MKKSISLALIFGVVALSSAAFAGKKWANSVNFDGSVIWGLMGSVRNSADSVQYMGCGITGDATSTVVRCFAKTNTSPPVTKACFSSDPRIVRAAQSIASDSKVEFATDAATGECTILSVSTDSRNEPKKM